MNDDVKRWHKDVLMEHNTMLFKSLLSQHNISSKKKEVLMLPLGVTDKDKAKTHIGYFAVKGDEKYFITPKQYKELPLQINEISELKYREDVVVLPIRPNGFRVMPNHTFEFRDMVDDYMSFRNSNPDAYTLCKIIVFMLQIGRGYVCISSNKGFGKSFLFVNMDFLTNMCNVCDEVRSGPMVLQQINETGNIVFDDLVGVTKEVRDTMERVQRAFAGGKSKYRNGALKSAWTKDIYNGPLQSITSIYNNINHYDHPEKYYFDVMFENNIAMDDRFLKFKFEGVLEEEFSNDFNMFKVAEENRDYYINIAKEIMYLQQYKLSNEYKRKWVTNSVLTFNERKRAVYDELCWGIDNYCKSQEEYDKFVSLLDQAIIDYRDMVSSYGLVSTVHKNIEEEVVEDE